MVKIGFCEKHNEVLYGDDHCNECFMEKRIEYLEKQLHLAKLQDYCTMCGNVLDGYHPPDTSLIPSVEQQNEMNDSINKGQA